MSIRPDVAARLLIVDDDTEVLDYLVETFEDADYRSVGVRSGAAALKALATQSFDLVISDVEMPGMRGPELLQAIHARDPLQLVVLITAFGSIDLAVQLVRSGAVDFVTKPFRFEVLLLAVERALRERQLRREIVRLRSPRPTTGLLAETARSAAMRHAAEIAMRAAASDVPVLLTGESGSGKGFFARAVHQQSARAGGPFVQVNCAALPSALVESELFGVVRGAFTDARADRPGLFQQAHGGTLFLDEIGEMPLEAQPKLLQVLESSRVRPVGGSQEVEVDVRVVAATNMPLEDAMRERRFRSDLYYRLNVVRLDLPPLRERREDIPALVDVILQRIASRSGREVVGVSGEAMRWLLSQPWPGNVRELTNVLERAIALTQHDTLVIEDVRATGEDDGALNDLAAAAARETPLVEVEAAYIQRVLDHVQGNKSMAARILGIDRRTLYRRLGEPEQ